MNEIKDLQKDYIEDGPRLQPNIIKDGVGDVILSSATGVLKVTVTDQ
jgi:hypothetical protein